MKKKTVSLLLAATCALGCALSLTACGDKEPEKAHTAEQWTTAFSDPATIKCHSLNLNKNDAKGDFVGNIYVINIDDNIGYYYYNHGDSSQTLLKKDGYFYERLGDDDKTYELTSAAFDTKVNAIKQNDSTQKLLDLCKTSYDDFSAFGTFLDGDVTGHLYTAENLSFTDAAGKTQTLSEVHVKIKDSDNSLFKVFAKYEGEDPDAPGVTANFTIEYRKDQSYAETVANVSTPERVAGRTFYLATIDAFNEDYGEAHDKEMVDDWIAQVLADNTGKTITVNKDGTLSGNIEIDMGNETTLALNTLKYTEDFSRTANPYGKITVSNAPTNTITLTGVLNDGYNSNANLPLSIIQPAPHSDGDNIYTFTFRLPTAN